MMNKNPHGFSCNGRTFAGWVVLTTLLFSAQYALAQGELINGGNHTGAIAANEEDSWTFNASIGDYVLLRVSRTSGAAAFAPRLRVFDNGGKLLATASGAGSSATSSARLDHLAAASGTLVLKVDSAIAGSTGNYRVDFLRIPAPFVVPGGETGGPLANEGRHEGAIAVGDVDPWTFSVAAGDFIDLRIAKVSEGTAFVPRVRVYNAAGLLVGETIGGPAFSTSEGRVALRLQTADTFTAVVDSTSPEGTGNYRLHLVKLPGSVVTPGSDTGEALANGGNHDGAITAGDLDVWTFNAEVGSRLFLRAARTSGDTTFTPRIRVYNSQGVLVGSGPSDSPVSEARLDYTNAQAGSFSVIVDSASFEGVGGYRLFYLQLPGPYVIPSGDDGAPLVSGNNHDGTGGSGDLDVWTFTADAGNRVTFRLTQSTGGTTYSPRMRIFDSGGTLVGYAESRGASTTSSSYLSMIVSTSGTFNVVIDSSLIGGAGNYRLHFFRENGTYTYPSPSGTLLSSGGNYEGSLSQRETNSWTFTANAGEQILLRAARLTGNTSWFRPWVRLYGPDGNLVAEGNAAGNQDNEVNVVADRTATYTVAVSSYYPDYDGTYRLSYLKASGNFTVPGGDDGGLMINGGNFEGAIPMGDIDAWTFTASAGDRVLVRAARQTGDTSWFRPWVRLYGPNGSLIAEGKAADAQDNGIEIIAPQTASYTVVISSYYPGYDGTYRLHYINVPEPFTLPGGDDGGVVVNGGNHEGAIPVADIDVWMLSANAGDRVLLRATRLTGHTSWFRPWIRLYGPDGALVAAGDAASAQDNAIDVVADRTAIYTVIVSSYYADFEGTYRLHYLKVPGTYSVPGGDDGGLLSNGGNHEGTITVADIDAWTLSANAGDRVLLRAARLTGHTTWYRPWVRLYGPDGVLLAAGDAASSHDNSIDFIADESTNYTVVVSSYYADFEGTYRLHYLKVPGTYSVPGGDDGGPLFNGGNHEGAITMADIDAWTLLANAGDRVLLRAARLTGHTTWFRPVVRLYRSDGSLVAQGEAADSHDNGIDIVVDQTANYTVVVTGFYAGHDGTYRLHSLRLPGAFMVPAGDDGGPIANGGNHEGGITAGDIDAWTFEADHGDSIILQMQELTGSSFTPSLQLYGPTGVLLASHSHASLAQLSFTAADGGIFVVVASSGVGGTGTYRLNESGLSEQGKQLRYARLSQDTFTVNWPATLAGYVLQQNPGLEPSGWEDVGVVAANNGLNVRLTFPVGPGNRFFRLRP